MMASRFWKKISFTLPMYTLHIPSLAKHSKLPHHL
jgi:hypothetical protein